MGLHYWGAPTGPGQVNSTNGHSAFGSTVSMSLNWLFGTGPDNMTFGPNSPHIANLRDLPAVQGAIALYNKKNQNAFNDSMGCSAIQPVTNYGSPFGAEGYIDAWADTNPTWHFVGSFTVEVFPAGGSDVKVVINNNSSFASLTNRIFPAWERSTFGPMGSMRQTYWWTQSRQ